MTADVARTLTDATPDDDILKVQDIVHRYDDVVALNHVSLTVRRGEFLTLLGPSGSGKSTLLRTIAGLETPESVAVMTLNGKDIRGIPANQRDVATVFQHFALFPHMTVGANVEYGLRVRGVDAATRRQQAREALAMVRLESKYDRRIFQLSGGEKQRVALARSLVIEPDILLLDEPLGALDERLRLDMQIELVELHKRTGRTFILVTHSQEEAITMSDRIVLMCKAQIEQISDPQTMFEQPETPFAARFMGVENVFEGTVVARDGDVLGVDVGGTLLRGTANPTAATPSNGARTAYRFAERLPAGSAASVSAGMPRNRRSSEIS